jgi:hypothetical protein
MVSYAGKLLLYGGLGAKNSDDLFEADVVKGKTQR